MEILNQLGELFLAAVPAVVIVVLFYLVLRWSFFAPLQRVMAEREKRIEGARRDAESLRAAAEEKRRARVDAVRKARQQIFSEQEAGRRVVLNERNAAILQARTRANEELQAARRRIKADLTVAQNELQHAGDGLADEIVRSIMDKARLSPVGESR